MQRNTTSLHTFNVSDLYVWNNLLTHTHTHTHLGTLVLFYTRAQGAGVSPYAEGPSGFPLLVFLCIYINKTSTK